MCRGVVFRDGCVYVCEEMRKERLEEHKVREHKDTETHKATTIYHGVNSF